MKGHSIVSQLCEGGAHKEKVKTKFSQGNIEKLERAMSPIKIRAQLSNTRHAVRISTYSAIRTSTYYKASKIKMLDIFFLDFFSAFQ
jgi:hypothetical protein